LAQRYIPRHAVLDAVDTYEIIEPYPEDKYLPSYLVYAEHEGLAFHVIFAVDVEARNVRIVTAYRPSPDRWSTDFRRRGDS